MSPIKPTDSNTAKSTENVELPLMANQVRSEVAVADSAETLRSRLDHLLAQNSILFHQQAAISASTQALMRGQSMIYRGQNPQILRDHHSQALNRHDEQMRRIGERRRQVQGEIDRLLATAFPQQFQNELAAPQDSMIPTFQEQEDASLIDQPKNSFGPHHGIQDHGSREQYELKVQKALQWAKTVKAHAFEFGAVPTNAFEDIVPGEGRPLPDAQSISREDRIEVYDCVVENLEFRASIFETVMRESGSAHPNQLIAYTHSTGAQFNPAEELRKVLASVKEQAHRLMFPEDYPSQEELPGESRNTVSREVCCPAESSVLKSEGGVQNWVPALTENDPSLQSTSRLLPPSHHQQMNSQSGLHHLSRAQMEMLQQAWPTRFIPPTTPILQKVPPQYQGAVGLESKITGWKEHVNENKTFTRAQTNSSDTVVTKELGRAESNTGTVEITHTTNTLKPEIPELVLLSSSDSEHAETSTKQPAESSDNWTAGFPDAQCQYLARLWNERRNLPAIVTSSCTFSLTQYDIMSLKPGAWLNDAVVDSYIRLLYERSCEGLYAEFTYLTSHSASDIVGRRFERVDVAAKRLKVFEDQRKVIIVPFCVRGHWTVVFINVRLGVIMVYNSLISHTASSIYLPPLQDWLTKHRESWGNYTIHYCITPQQTNTFDCGCFLLQTVKFWTEQKPLDATDFVTDETRFRIGCELISGKLDGYTAEDTNGERNEDTAAGNAADDLEEDTAGDTNGEIETDPAGNAAEEEDTAGDASEDTARNSTA